MYLSLPIVTTRRMARLTFFMRKIKYIFLAACALYAFLIILSNINDKDVNRSLVVTGTLENSDATVTKFVLERIDWNNYSLMESDARRSGLAEHGIEVVLDLSSEEQDTRQKLLDKYKYDAYLSDRISLERSIGDIRPEACKRVKYIKDIPENSVSIIIPMFNEKNSTLLRTIHSIINRSPAILLKEVIVVDDFSQEDELKAPLDDYVREHFSKVKIIRNKQREGLIRSRIIGADASTGSFLVFLDSHIEVNYNYLPPLLEIIVQNYRTIACPAVDFVKKNFKIETVTGERVRGGFNWDLNFRRMPMTTSIDAASPHANPIMVGCAFAISRKWWDEIGKYDQGLDVWGVEQYELSVKSWLCGGSVVDSPCSRLAHLFRDWPYVKEVASAFGKNAVRFATVWMDGYREVLFDRKPHWRNLHPGNDIFKQIELKKRLKCKPFDWFLTEVAPDILKLFPIVEPPPLASGLLINKSNTSLCANVKDENIYLSNCNSEQISVFTYDWRLRIGNKKMQSLYAIAPDFLIMGKYHDIDLNDIQSFVWDPKSGRIVNPHSGWCLDFKPDTHKLCMSDCVYNKTSQSWTFETYNVSRVIETWNNYGLTL